MKPVEFGTRSGRVFIEGNPPLRAVFRTSYGHLQVDIARVLVPELGLKEGDRAVPVLDAEVKALGLLIGNRGSQLRFLPGGNVRYIRTIAAKYRPTLVKWYDSPSYYHPTIEEVDGHKCVLFGHGDLLKNTPQEPKPEPDPAVAPESSTDSPPPNEDSVQEGIDNRSHDVGTNVDR